MSELYGDRSEAPFTITNTKSVKPEFNRFPFSVTNRRHKSQARILCEKLLRKYPHISNKELQRIIQQTLKQRFKLDYIRNLKMRCKREIGGSTT